MVNGAESFKSDINSLVNFHSAFAEATIAPREDIKAKRILILSKS